MNDADSRDWLAVSWKLDILRGAGGVLFGVIAMAWPVETVVALAVLWGCWALFDGIGAVALAFSPGATAPIRAWAAVVGLIAIAAAFFAILSPGVAAVTLTWILGIWLIVRGVLEVVEAFLGAEGRARLLLVLAGALSVVVGVLFAWKPGGSAVALATWLGVLALLWGVVLLTTGLWTRRELAGLDPVASS